jgi:hypothetical protein
LVLPADSELFGLLHHSDHYDRARSDLASATGKVANKRKKE